MMAIPQLVNCHHHGVYCIIKILMEQKIQDRLNSSELTIASDTTVD